MELQDLKLEENEKINSSLMNQLISMVNGFVAASKKEEGQGLAEYALILVLIAIVVIAALTTLGTQIDSVFGDITAGLGG